MEKLTDKQLIEAYLLQVQQEITEAAMKQGMNATGRTLQSFETKTTATGGELYANSNIYFMEHGRGPTGPGPYKQTDQTLLEAIKEWIEAKNLDLNPYAVTNKIHKLGTRLYRQGGNSGVLSVPLADTGLERLFDELELWALDQAFSEVHTPVNDFQYF